MSSRRENSISFEELVREQLQKIQCKNAEKGKELYPRGTEDNPSFYAVSEEEYIKYASENALSLRDLRYSSLGVTMFRCFSTKDKETQYAKLLATYINTAISAVHSNAAPEVIKSNFLNDDLTPEKYFDDLLKDFISIPGNGMMMGMKSSSLVKSSASQVGFIICAALAGALSLPTLALEKAISASGAKGAQDILASKLKGDIVETINEKLALNSADVPWATAVAVAEDAPWATAVVRDTPPALQVM